MPLEIHYSELGSGEPIILLHGLFGSSRNWRSFARRLQANFRVITADLRNHGASPHAEDMDYDDMADDVSALLDKLKLNQATLIGHSMGGKVAMVLTLRSPRRIKRLLAIDIAPVSYKHSFDPIVRAMKALPVDCLSSRAQADRQLSAWIQDTVLRQFLLQNLVSTHEGFKWRVHLNAISSNSNAIVGFPEFNLGTRYHGPVCFIGGADSDYITAEYHDPISRYFPNACLHLIPDAGHWLHVEQPDRFLDVVLGCLRGD